MYQYTDFPLQCLYSDLDLAQTTIWFGIISALFCIWESVTGLGLPNWWYFCGVGEGGRRVGRSVGECVQALGVCGS